MARAKAAADGVRIGVRVTDDLDLATLPALRAELDRVLQAHPATIEVDLSSCGFVGVDGVTTLAGAAARARRQGTELLLVGLRPAARRVVRLLGFEQELLPR